MRSYLATFNAGIHASIIETKDNDLFETLNDHGFVAQKFAGELKFELTPQPQHDHNTGASSLSLSYLLRLRWHKFWRRQDPPTSCRTWPTPPPLIMNTAGWRQAA